MGRANRKVCLLYSVCTESSLWLHNQKPVKQCPGLAWHLGIGTAWPTQWKLDDCDDDDDHHHHQQQQQEEEGQSMPARLCDEVSGKDQCRRPRWFMRITDALAVSYFEAETASHPASPGCSPGKAKRSCMTNAGPFINHDDSSLLWRLLWT